ncbi:MAG: hypothetical protein JRE81_16035, partial [Deltaproteobacteria bacterium]|nr:hypothetical protein [Deltaproteobacteria bacterium]
MLSVSHRGACLVMLAVAVSGCFNLDFGSGDSDIEGCGATPESIAMELEARYALGAETTLSLSGLENPSITSSHPDVIRVGPIHGDGQVTLSFVGVGEASITVSEASEEATVSIAVAELERFEVALPFYTDPLIPLSGKSVILPEFQVAYFDSHGRLYGRGLAETSWPSSESNDTDLFRNYSLESGPHLVEVRVGALESTILFGAVAPEELVSLQILETDLGQGRVRVDAVGLTESGTEVWNINPYFHVDDDFFVLSFEYTFDPDAPPSLVIAESFPLTIGGLLDPA